MKLIKIRNPGKLYFIGVESHENNTDTSEA